MKLTRTFLMVATAVASLMSPQLRATTVFPIATNLSLYEISRGIAFDGTNYLVGMEVGTNVVGQLVSSSGALLGPQIVVGSNPANFFPSIALAFGQANYLLVWSDTSVTSGVDMFGQFISTSGVKVGSAFNLLQSQGSHGFQYVLALASDGTNYLVVWADNYDTESQTSGSFYGQLVTPAGTLSGSEFLISSQIQNGNYAAATFGQTNYLVVWKSNNGNVGNTNQAYGEFVSRDGSAGSPFQISQTASVDQNPLAVAFDGTNYLAVWPWDPGPETEMNVTNWQLFARLVSQTGSFPGSELALITNLNASIPSLAFDGANYLLAYGFDSNTTNADRNLRCQFLDRSASLVGLPFTPFTPQGTNVPLFALNGLLFDGNRFAMAATLGTIAQSNGNTTGFPSSEVFGAFIPAGLCDLSIDPTNAAFAAAGGSDSVSVTASNGCAWTAVSNDGFITITSGTNGTGDGTVQYTVAANTSTNSLMGTMTIAGETFTVTQSGASAETCTFTLSATSVSLPAKGGTKTVKVKAKGTDCAWTAVSNDDFITIIAGAIGSGNGTVDYSVSGNTNTTIRTGTIMIAGETFTVNQAAGGCKLTLSPKDGKFKAAGGSATVKVKTNLSDCDWTAISNDSFITITAGASGAGNGAVSYTVAANTNTTAISGSIAIGGQTFTITQSAAP